MDTEAWIRYVTDLDIDTDSQYSQVVSRQRNMLKAIQDQIKTPGPAWTLNHFSPGELQFIWTFIKSFR